MKHVLACSAFLIAPLAAQNLVAPFDSAYTLVDLGTVAGMPGAYGGLVFKDTDPNVLLLASGAGLSTGAIYEVPVVRSASGHVTGFGTPTLAATTPNIDGGLCYAPNGTPLFTTWPGNGLGQILPATSTPARTLTLTNYGLTSSTGSCQFVPVAHPAGGRFKICTYTTDTLYDVTLVPHAANDGTWDITTVNATVPLVLTWGGLEGIVYPPPGSPLIPDFTKVLLTEYVTWEVVLYTIDLNGDVVPGTGQTFLTNAPGAEGGTIDPVTNDFFFSTTSGTRILRVEGFGPCGRIANYGTGNPGTNGRLPAVACGGCSLIGQTVSLQVGSALPGAFGVLTAGFQQTNVQVLPGIFVLNDMVASFAHVADPTGAFSFPLFIPPNPAYSGVHLFWQAGYLDVGATFGISTSRGIDQTVR